MKHGKTLSLGSHAFAFGTLVRSSDLDCMEVGHPSQHLTLLELVALPLLNIHHVAYLRIVPSHESSVMVQDTVHMLLLSRDLGLLIRRWPDVVWLLVALSLLDVRLVIQILVVKCVLDVSLISHI